MKKIICFFLTLLFTFALVSCNSEDPIKIDFLAISKADCIVIRDGKQTVMIDTGEEENADEILSFLSSCGIAKIDCLILTHFDKDHAGGFEKISETIEFSRIIRPEYESQKPHFEIFCNKAESLGIKPEILREKSSFSIGNLQFTLHPTQQTFSKKPDNNSSIITELSAKGKSVLFCGDAENARLEEFMSTEIHHYDLIKMPHHGAYHEPLKELVSGCGANYCVITDSDKNPAEIATLALLEEAGITSYETKNGTVSVHLYSERNLYITQK